MLTIKQITKNTEAVLRGLEKKHFKNAKETIDQVIALNDKRRSTQNELDKNLAEVNSLSRTIGQLMKEGKKEEAETARARVAELKEGNKELDAAMTQAATDMQNVLYTIPNIPYDSVPEGVGAEDNVVEKMGGMETELPKDALPHWELAKKYDLIDFDLGVKITGAGFPVYKGKGAVILHFLYNIHSIFKILLGLPRKSYNNICCNCQIRHCFFDFFNQCKIMLLVIVTVHFF